MPERRALTAVVALAAALRLTYVLVYPQTALCEDCRMYDEVAQHVAAGLGFVGGFGGETYHQPVVHDPNRPEIGIGPIFPTFLASIYRVAGHRADAVRVVQAVVSAVTLIPLFGLVRSVLGSRAALRTSWVAAVYPPLIIYSGVVLTETLSTALLVFALWSVADAWECPGLYRCIRTGIVMGVAVLLREEFLAVFGAVAALTIWRSTTTRSVVGVATVALVALMTIAPWTIRNYRTFGRVIPVSAHGGDTLYLSVKGWTEWHFGDPELQRLSAMDDYLAQSDALRAAAFDEIRAHPLTVAARRLVRFPDFWLSSHTANVSGIGDAWETYLAEGHYGILSIKFVLLVINCAAIAFGIVGLVRAARRASVDRAGILLLATPIAVIAAVHLVLFSAPRYQLPLLPFVLAGVGWLLA
ncbi:MAG TPA: glycosyltransferase family 39 protein [Vicinamibacterales bacterium]|nr:glycosyltransferase family 39 protein [Vicinamibacterales bacterium]